MSNNKLKYIFGSTLGVMSLLPLTASHADKPMDSNQDDSAIITNEQIVQFLKANVMNFSFNTSYDKGIIKQSIAFDSNSMLTPQGTFGPIKANLNVEGVDIVPILDMTVIGNQPSADMADSDVLAILGAQNASANLAVDVKLPVSLMNSWMEADFSQTSTEDVSISLNTTLTIKDKAANFDLKTQASHFDAGDYNFAPVDFSIGLSNVNPAFLKDYNLVNVDYTDAADKTKPLGFYLALKATEAKYGDISFAFNASLAPLSPDQRIDTAEDMQKTYIHNLTFTVDGQIPKALYDKIFDLPAAGPAKIIISMFGLVNKDGDMNKIHMELKGGKLMVNGTDRSDMLDIEALSSALSHSSN